MSESHGEQREGRKLSIRAQNTGRMTPRRPIKRPSKGRSLLDAIFVVVVITTVICSLSLVEISVWFYRKRMLRLRPTEVVIITSTGIPTPNPIHPATLTPISRSTPTPTLRPTFTSTHTPTPTSSSTPTPSPVTPSPTTRPTDTPTHTPTTVSVPAGSPRPIAPCFDTQFQRLEPIESPLPEVRGYIYGFYRQGLENAVVEIYVKGLWSRFNKQRVTLNDGGFFFDDVGGSLNHEYIVRVIDAPYSSTAYHTWDEPYTFKFETHHQRAVVNIFQIPFSADRCHLPHETQ